MSPTLNSSLMTTGNLDPRGAGAVLPLWPEVGSLTLAALYAELSRIDVLDREIRKQLESAKEDDPKGSLEPAGSDAENEVEEAPLTVTCQINQQRIALRTRAMELSRSRLRPLGILNLPLDILRDIFDFVEGLSLRQDRNSVIQNARLVCHVFNKLASRLLCPQLHIRLDKKSLASAEKLLGNDLIAGGIRDIKVGLDYRPKELATDLARFTALRMEDLNDMENRCSYFHETWFLGGHDKDEDICPLPFKDYDTALDNACTIRRAWTKYLDSGATDDEDSDILAYQRILLDSHAQYRRLHEEQLQMIDDGSFATMITKFLSRLSPLGSLVFTDEARSDDDIRLNNNETFYLNNKEELANLMTMADDWRTIEQIPGGVELTSAKLLSELPIACHKAGITLRKIRIECFPVENNYAMTQPSLSWEDLRTACLGLEMFDFGGSKCLNCAPIRKEHIRPAERAHIDAYLHAMTSGNLHAIGISMYAFGLNDGRTDRKDCYPFGHVFGTPNWPRLRTLSLSSITLSEAELSRICAELSDNVKHLHLSFVTLQVGSWVRILDTLRERIGANCKTQQCKFYFTSPGGGEFGMKKPKAIDPFAWMDTKSSAWAALWQEPLLVVQARRYISCDDGMTENPLKSDETLILQKRNTMVESDD